MFTLENDIETEITHNKTDSLPHPHQDIPLPVSDQSQEKREERKKLQLKDPCKWLSCNDKEQINDNNPLLLLSSKSVQSRDKSSKFLFSIGRRGTQFGEFHGVFGVASDHKNKRIITTDCHNNRIQIFGEDGKFVFAFGQKGFGDGSFQNPTGVGVGPNGEVVVCERLKGRIQVRVLRIPKN